nr:dematin isoform X4 [Gorilla gorilla gorilla]
MERLQKAKMDNQVLGYKDLAAIPKDKAILDIERPDLMIYEPHFTYSLLEHVELPRSREVWADSRSPGIISQASAPRTTGTPRTSLPHFHHPETSRPDSNIYKKPPIYKQRESVGGSPQTKHLIEDLIIESSKFPAAQPPDPNQPAKIETDYWPCPPSLAVVETEWRKRKASRRGAEEEEEEEDDDSGEEMKALRERQREELSKVTSNLGKMILKEEMEKSLPIRRKTRSLPDRTPFHTSLHQGTSKSSSLPAYGRTTLSRLQSTEFSPSGSETGSPGLQVSASWRGTGGAAEAGSWHLKVSGKGGCGATELPGEEEEAGVRLGRSPCPALAHCGFGLPRTERARGGGWTGGTPCPVCWSRRSIPMKC